MKLFNKKESFCIIADEATRFKVCEFVDKYAIGEIDTEFYDDLIRFKFQAKKTGKMMWEKICKKFGQEFYKKGSGNVFLIVQKRGVA